MTFAWGIANDPDETQTTQMVQTKSDVRWHIEHLHRELKQVTGSEQCQCRTARAERTPIACCDAAGVSLKVKAIAMQTTVSAGKHLLVEALATGELRSPQMSAFQVIEAKNPGEKEGEPCPCSILPISDPIAGQAMCRGLCNLRANVTS